MNKAGSTFWKASGGLVGLVALAAILVAGNLIFSNVRVRKDFTNEKLYTLSSGTVSVLKKLDQDVTLKLFFSRSLPEVPPGLKNYADEIQDLLAEYVEKSGGKVTLEILDPAPDSNAEEWAQRYGISGQPMDMFGAPVYFGLVAVMGGQEEAIPALDPQAEGSLEYNITRLIYRIGHPEKPVVGVMSELPVLGQKGMPFAMPGQPRPPSSAPWLIFQDLAGDYDLQEVPVNTGDIDPRIKSLVVVHPKDLPDTTLYAIDQFVMRGGRLMVLVDPMSVADLESAGAASPFGMPKSSSDMKPLFNAWGVTYEADKVIADPKSPSRVRVADGRVEDSSVWLTLGQKNVNRDDVLTSSLEQIMLPFAGSVSAEGSKDLKVTSLLKSSEGSALVSAMSAQFGEQALRGEFKSGGVPLNIAIRLTGKFKTAFPGGRPKPQPAEGEAAPEPAATEPGLTEGESAVVIIADSDMIFDRFCITELNFLGAKAQQPINDNMSFFGNSLEQIAGSSDLIGIRSRGRFSRPFDKVIALQQKAMTDWQEKEKYLEEELKQTQQQLSEMQTSKDKNQRYILSEQQKQAIDSFQKKEIAIKKDLKLVRKNLRHDIEWLGVKVKIANIVIVPLLISFTGIAFWLHRRKIKAGGRKETQP